jgi:hypothetical protein
MNGNDVKEKIIAVLKEAHPAFIQLQDEFFIIGSSALILSGVPVRDTKDIDLLTSSRDAKRLKTLWKEKKMNYHPVEINRFKSDFARFHFGLLDIEVMADLEVYSKGQWRKVTVNNFRTVPLNLFQIKIPTLADQVRILQLFGRPKDADKIALVKKMM